VDDRLNGDGAGIALGVNDPVLGAHLLGVFTAIWALYYVANNSDGFLQVRAALSACWGRAHTRARARARPCPTPRSRVSSTARSRALSEQPSAD
jgi:hypothetical protein